MLLGAAGEIGDVVKNLLAVGFSTGISKAFFTPAAAFGKCWLGFVPSGRIERSWGQIYLLLLVCAAYWGSLTQSFVAPLNALYRDQWGLW